MRLIFVLFFAVVALFAEPKTPEESFVFSALKESHAYKITLNLDKNVYLYKNKLKIQQNSSDISSNFEFSSQIHGGDEVIFDKIELDFPFFSTQEDDVIDIAYQGCSLEGLCYQPLNARFHIKNSEISMDFSNQLKQKNAPQSAKSESEKISNDLQNSSFYISLLTFFAYGLLLSLTPCTLPMVPIISSILAKNSGKNPLIASIIYVLGMSLSYTAAGILTALLGTGMQAFFQNPVVIIIFALIFIALSLSMFGLYELKMPNKFNSFLNAKSANLSGLLGVFVMGILSALIVGPCVAAPLAGLLIYIANSNDLILGAASLFVMSLGLGVPLICIGFGFKFLKAGSWMQKINHFFAFVMLAMAAFFLERILPQMIINIIYCVILVGFCVFFGLFESANSKFAKAKQFLLALLFAATIVFASSQFSSVKTSEQLHFQRAQNELILDEKNIIYFTASWCENCKELKNTSFKNSDVLEFFKDFNLIKIDLTKPNEFEKNMAKKYQVFGPPVLVMVDKKGKVLKQINGYKNAKDLLKSFKN